MPGNPVPVVTVATTFCDVPVTNVTEVGATLHVYDPGSVGVLLQGDTVTVPEKPFNGVNVMVYLWVAFPLTVADVGDTVMLKFPTYCATDVELLVL